MVPEESEYMGKWRLPRSTKSLEGTLRCNHNEAIILELEGCFDEPANYYEIILGETSRGEKITAVDANINGIELFTQTEGEIRKYTCELYLIGKHFNRFNDIKINKLYIDYTYITEWMLPSQTFSGDLVKKNAEPKTDNGRIYQIEEKKIAHEAKLNSIHSKLIFNLELRYFGDLQKSCEFKYISYIIVEPDEPKELKWYLDLNDNLCNLLTLLTSHPVYSGYLSGEIEDKTHVSIFFLKSEPSISKNISRHEIDIKYEDLNYFQKENYIEICINNWFAKRDKLKPIYELFHMISYTPTLYRETYFLTLMQALEAFYGNICENDNYLEKGAWRFVRDKLMEAIPEIAGEIPSSPKKEDLIENIGNKIKYGNNFSLKTKMLILFNKPHLKYLRGSYGGFGDDKIKRICDSRDYFTHHGEDYKGKSMCLAGQLLG